MQQTDYLSKGFDRQVTELVKASKHAEQAQLLERIRSEVGVERFLQNAAFIVERLQSFAVDIPRVYQTQVDEEMWKEFYKGDTAVFLRSLLKSLTRAELQAIKNCFEENAEFREFVSRYMAEFKSPLHQVWACDRPDVLAAAFTSTDVGKLYLTLAKALGAHRMRKTYNDTPKTGPHPGAFTATALSFLPPGYFCNTIATPVQACRDGGE